MGWRPPHLVYEGWRPPPLRWRKLGLPLSASGVHPHRRRGGGEDPPIARVSTPTSDFCGWISTLAKGGGGGWSHPHRGVRVDLHFCRGDHPLHAPLQGRSSTTPPLCGVEIPPPPPSTWRGALHLHAPLFTTDA